MALHEEFDVSMSWRLTTSLIAGWALPRQQPDVSVAHLQGRPATGKSYLIPLSLYNTMAEQKSPIKVLHVVDESKLPLIKEYHEKNSTGLKDRVVTASYATALSKIKMATSILSQARLFIGDFTSQIVIIIDIDRDCSAAFALFMVAVAEWANVAATIKPLEEHALPPTLAVRIITVSNDLLHPALASILGRLGTLRLFTLEPPLRSRPKYATIACELDSQGIFDGITSKMKLDESDETHAVIWFRDWYGLGEHYQSADRDCNETFISIHKNCQVYLVGNSFRHPELAKVYDHVHIVTSLERPRFVFDASSSQVTLMSVAASPQDRRMQLSCAFRTITPLFNVTVYTDNGFMDGLDSSPAINTSLDIANQDMAGFLAALTDIAAPMIPTLQALYPAPAAKDEVVRRMHDMGLFKTLHVQNDFRYEVNVDGDASCTRAFFNLLPLFNYNTRLAHFVAQRARPNIMGIKVLLATLLNHGFETVTSIDDGKQAYEEAKKLPASAIKPLVGFGTIWWYLALWNVASQSESKDNFCLPGVAISCNSEKFIKERIETASDIMRSRGVSVARLLPNPPAVLSTSQCQELQWHLLKAYADMLVSVKRDTMQMMNGQRVSMNANLKHLVSWKSLKGIEGSRSAIMGVGLGLYKTDEESFIKQWVWIPRELTQRYEREVCSLKELRGQYGRTK